MPSHTGTHAGTGTHTHIVRCMHDGGFGSARLQEVHEDELPILLRVRAVLLRTGRVGLTPGPISTGGGRARAGPISLTRSAALLPCCNNGAARAVVAALT